MSETTRIVIVMNTSSMLIHCIQCWVTNQDLKLVAIFIEVAPGHVHAARRIRTEEQIRGCTGNREEVRAQCIHQSTHEEGGQLFG